jgi:hypothetical protein
MKKRLIIAGLIVAAASTAAAQPWPYNDDPQRYDRHGQFHPRGQWVELADNVQNDRQRVFIPVGRQAGRFEKVLFDVDRGSVLVRQIVVQFANGRDQRIRVDRYIGARQGGLVIDLNGRRRAIQRVIVYTEPGYRRYNRGTYSVYAT